MLCLGIIIGFILGVCGYDYQVKKKVSNAKTLEDFKKML